MSVAEVVVHLRANNILTPHQADLIHAKETRLDRTEIIIEFLQQLGPKAFHCFMNSLKVTRQKDIFSKLNIERKKLAERENLRKSAEQGNADAQFNLGLMYENGQSVPKSYKQAVKWYKKSAEQGDADGQFNLGKMYKNGWGVPKSDDEAVIWFK
uniref:CARD domain-containing protein n=1 Tax=Plectus sambesii TaxID=2011161 RepID=A0A914VDN6_9BILA